jgi:hypothetical protein
MDARPGVGNRSSWCTLCHLDWETPRTTPESKRKLYARFDAKVERGSPCWRWTAGVSNTGYGSISVEGKTCYAHRIAYERLRSGAPMD